MPDPDKEAVKGEDTGRIRGLTEQLQQVSYALSQQLYQAQGPGGDGRGPSTTQGTPGDEGVVEGEFREV